MQLNEPVLPIQGECRSNPELFRSLAAEMGFDEPCFKDTDEDLIEQALNSGSPYLEGIDLALLQRDGWAKLKVPEGGLFPNRIPTPSGKFEFYSATMAARGLPPLPTHTPLAEPEGRYPLAFITPPNHRFLNSTCSNDERMQRLEGERPTVQLHPRDAYAQGIVTGDPVVVFNGRGECDLLAEVTEDVLPGTAVSLGLWWDDPQRGLSSINHLTDTRVSDMGGGATFFSVRVGVRKTPGRQ